MAIHKSIAISGADLTNRVEDDSGTDLAVLIDWKEGEPDPAAQWWVVSWPDHVTTPRYNGDATYAPCATKGQARLRADAVYGEIADSRP